MVAGVISLGRHLSSYARIRGGLSLEEIGPWGKENNVRFTKAMRSLAKEGTGSTVTLLSDIKLRSGEIGSWRI